MENEVALQSAFEHLLQARRAKAQPIKRVDRDPDGSLLSASQRRLWIAHQLDPESSDSNRPLGIRLKGKLDIHALQASLNEIVRRHEALRTVFPGDTLQPVQRVLPELTVTLELRNLGMLPGPSQTIEAQRVTLEEAERSFDLAKGPLIRPVLLRLSSEEHVLLLLMHHIIFDGWSENVLLHELQVLYEAFRTGKQPPLPELPIQYIDFASWQHHRLQDRIAELLQYWKGQLAEIPPALALPTDYPRKHGSASRSAQCSIVIGTALSTELKAVSRRENVTLFMTLLSVFQLLLGRYARQEDILVGVPAAGRTSPEAEDLIGCCMNVLVMRTKLTGEPTFREVLGRVRDTTIQAFARQALPFEKLVEELRPQREANRWPLFQVMFNFRNLPRRQSPKPDSLSLESFPIDRGAIGGLELSLEVKDTADGLHCTFNYARELFRPDTIEQMSRVFRTLLEAVAADVERPISSYSLLTEKERHQVLIDWNQTRRAYSRDRCIHELFEAQAHRTPEAIAVVGENQQITYKQLDAKANQLAHRLRKLGVAPEVLVAIYMDRSVDLVIALVAILKAGGAYVPLDPAYPKDRLAFMLDDTMAAAVITHSRLAGSLPEHRSKLICVDAALDNIVLEENQPPDSLITADNLAYVIYTSGSTGKPKGVMIPHGAVTNLVEVACLEYALGPGDRALQFASIGFDMSVDEIFPCLTSGATLVLRTDSMLESASIFLNRCRDWGITVLNLPTAYWHEITTNLSKGNLEIPASIRLVIFGGERAIPERLSQWRRLVPETIRLINAYGPTETTVWVTMAEISRTKKADAERTEVPIGRPIANTQIYLLDSHLNPVPVGVPGELYIAGAGLARGYLNRPELTAERFIRNPFSEEPGDRLYRSGDLARYLSNGDIELLGRSDDQVKIRGFRVEPGEIEAAVRQHPSVRTAVVLVREDPFHAKQLVAYLALQPEKSLNLRELRRFLMERLPAYMIPSAFVLLNSLPMTASGKVDHHALPAPDWERPEIQTNPVAPRNSFEEKLANIWIEILGLRQAGVHDNFFELGGHSLLATQLISRVHLAFGVHLSLRTLLEKPTLAELALVIEQRLTERATQRDLTAVLDSLESLPDV